MISFLMTSLRLLQALGRKSSDPDFRNILALVLILLITGTVFYASVEGWPILDALYFCVVTLSTVGYGDLAPKTALGKVFTIIYIFVGLGLFVAIVHDLAEDLRQHRQRAQQKRRSRKGK